MPIRALRLAILTIVLVAAPIARADELGDFNAAVEKAEGHNRVAIGYLRTGNIDLAWIEIDRMRDAWAALQQRFAGKRPQAFAGNDHYVTAMTDIAMRLIAADMMMKMGRPDPARQSLEGVRGDLYDLRKSAHINVLADCIRDANQTMDALMTYDDRVFDWSDAKGREALAAKASAYGALLDRCDGMADESVRNAPEFRRLIDGAKASLTLISKAIDTSDRDLLHRVLIELRSFDNLLAFRYG